MKNIQKLEICIGIATPITELLYICYFIYYFGYDSLINNPATSSTVDETVIIFAVVWLFSLLVAIGAYYDVTKQSALATVTLCIGAIFVIILLMPIGFFGLLYSGVLSAVLVVTPAILSAATMLIALSLKVKQEIITQLES